MIDPGTITRLAKQNQTTPLNIAREYLQHLFLGAFYRQQNSERVLFKGGTALRIVFGSPRFSEDLDFSGFRIRKVGMEDLVTETLHEIEKVGISVAITESKETTGGYLGIARSHFFDFDIQTQIEVSFRSVSTVQGENALIASDLVPAYTLLHLPEKLLIEEKLKALIERAKPRDFYDLYFILRKGVLPLKNRHLLAQAQDRIQKTAPKSLEELQLFLPQSQQAIAKDLRKTLERELKRYLA